MVHAKTVDQEQKVYSVEVKDHWQRLSALPMVLQYSSIQYVVLSFLSKEAVTKLQLLSKRFYNRFVPAMLAMMQSETNRFASCPIMRKNLYQYFIRRDLDAIAVVKLSPAPKSENFIEKLEYKAEWQTMRMDVVRKDANGNYEKHGKWNLGKQQAGGVIVMNPFMRLHDGVKHISAYIIGGMREGRYTDFTTQVIWQEGAAKGVVKQLERMPSVLMHHSAIQCRGFIVVTGGIQSASIDQGMLSQPPCS